MFDNIRVRHNIQTLYHSFDWINMYSRGGVQCVFDINHLVISKLLKWFTELIVTRALETKARFHLYIRIFLNYRKYVQSQIYSD